MYDLEDNMKCTECGYEYNSNVVNWLFHGDACYEIKSNIINAQLFIEIADHAFSIDPQQKEIYIDTWLIDSLPCRSCSLLNIRNRSDSVELVQKNVSRRFNLNYYF